MKHYKQEIYHTFLAAVLGLEEAIEDGWKIDHTNPAHVAGFHYAVDFVRDDEPEYKMTRAEILAKARAARTFGKSKGDTDVR